MSETPRKRGRPATIEPEAAMHAVVELFRAKGFAAVSLDDLSAATGLSRPSLYRAFGDKLAMYVGAMDAFGQQVSEEAIPELMRDGGLEAGLGRFFNAMLDIYYRADSIEPGCLVFGTAPSSADLPEVRARLRRGLEGLDAAMRARIRRSAPDSDDALVEICVGLASNTLIAFSARAKSGAEKSVLADMGAQSARAICLLLGLDA